MRNAFPLIWLVIGSLLASCDPAPRVQLARDEQAMLVGSRVRSNTTILTDTFVCYDKMLFAAGKPPLRIAVGNIADYTGKTSDSEGAVITRGGSLMLFSALGLMRHSVRLQDRFDTTVTDMEMKYINARQLGDGTDHLVENENVPWMPYFGGSIQKSDYVIMGGITEVNFNISSGGYNAEINQTGFKKRSFTMSIAADLRLVKTDSLEVVATSSFQKQFSGQEVNANVFSFFDVFNNKQLFDVYGGSIDQEPMQLGVRTILEEATLDLLAHANGISYRPCTLPPVAQPAALPPAQAVVQAPQPAQTVAQSAPLVVPQPAPPQPTPPQPVAQAPAPDRSGPMLMIGSYTVQANAFDAMQKLKAAGIPAQIEPFVRNGRPWWHVVAYVAPNEGLRARVARLGYPDAYFQSR